MDETRFDQWTKSLPTSQLRRSMLRTVLAGAIATVLGTAGKGHASSQVARGTYHLPGGYPVDRDGDLETTFKVGYSSDKQDDTQDFVIIDHDSSSGDHAHVVFDSDGNEIYNDSED